MLSNEQGALDVFRRSCSQSASCCDTVILATAVRVGSRRGEAVVLEVAAGEMHRAGHEFFESVNRVWLTEGVPPEYLKVLEGE